MSEKALKIFEYDFANGGVNIPYKHLIVAPIISDFTMQTNVLHGTDIEKFLQSLIASPSQRAIPQVIQNTNQWVHSIEADGYLHPTEVGADLSILLKTNVPNDWEITFSVQNSKGEGIMYDVRHWNYEQNNIGQFQTSRGLIRVKINHAFLIASPYYGTETRFEYREYGTADARNKDSQVKYLNVELFPYISVSEYSPAGFRKLTNNQITPYNRVLALCDITHR